MASHPRALADPERLAALRDSGLLDSEAEAAFDRWTSLASKLLRAPVSLLSLVDDTRQFFKSTIGLGEPWASRRETPLSHSFCQHVVVDGAALRVNDARIHPTLRHNAAVSDLAVTAYLGVPVTDDSGNVLGSFCVIDHEPREWSDRDLEVLVELAAAIDNEIALRRSLRLSETRQRLYETLVENLPKVTVLQFDRELRYQVANGSQLLALLGLKPQDLEGERVEDVTTPENLQRVLDSYTAALAGRSSEHVISRAGRWLLLHTVPVRGGDEAIVGGMSMSYDITDLHDARLALEDKSTLLEGVLEAMEERVVVVGADGVTQLTNRAAREAFETEGTYAGSPIDLQVWAEGGRLFEADGRTPCAPENLPHVRALKGEPVRDHELLVRSPTGHGGSWRRISAHPLWARGVVQSALVVSRDISAERTNADLLAERARETAFLLEVARTANSEVGMEEGLRTGLRLLCVEYGWPVGHVFLRAGDEMASSDIWFGEEGERLQRFVAETRALRFQPGQGMVGEAMQSGKLEALRIPPQGDSPRFIRLEAARAAGLGFGLWLPLTIGARTAAIIEVFGAEAAPFRSKYIEVLQSVGTLLGRVVERQEAKAELEAMARVDELTGLHNRRGFISLADQQLRLSRRFKRPLHLFFVDLDGMKQINDLHGHAAGDLALREMATVLRETFREADLLCRLGGDEFVVLAEGDPEGPLERLKTALLTRSALPDRRFVLAASIGVSKFDETSPEGIIEMLAAADALMYSEKRKRKRTLA